MEVAPPGDLIEYCLHVLAALKLVLTRNAMRWLVALILILLTGPAFAGTNTFATWEREIAAFEKSDAARPPPQDAILFVGSSNIRLWKTLQKDFAEFPTIRRGIGGCELSDIAHFADRMVVPYKPRTVVVSAGSNDIHNGRKPEVVLASFTQLVGIVRSTLPSTRFVFLSINPSPSRWEEVEQVVKANALVKAFVEAGLNMDYVNTFDAMLGPDGTPRADLFVGDALHNNPAGNTIRADIIRSHLD